MIIPTQTRQSFSDDEKLRESVFDQVRQIVYNYCERQGFAFLGRKKTLASTAEKIETGRVGRWSELDDLIAMTIIIPTLIDEVKAVNFCRNTFNIDSIVRRGRVPKPPESFRFDSTRVWCRLIPPPDFVATGTRSVYDIRVEIQVRSAFEHAWSVSTHDLAYKAQKVDWKRLRLAAQMKAAVEQLDSLILAYESTLQTAPSGTWQEVDRKKAIADEVELWFERGIVPSELVPLDLSRFADNLYSFLKCGGKQSESSDSLVVIERQLTEWKPEGIPRSSSFFQIAMSTLVTSGFIVPDDDEYFCHITADLETIFPAMRTIARRFDYSS